MVAAGAACRGRPHRPSPVARGAAAARAPWRGLGRGGRGPGAGGGSSAAPSRALGAGSAAQRSGGGGGRRSRAGGRPVAAAAAAGGGDGGGGGGPGPGWRAGGSCDPDTRSPPGRGAGAGRGRGRGRRRGPPPAHTPPPAAAGERGRTAQGAGLPGGRRRIPEGGARAGGARPEGGNQTRALRTTLLPAFLGVGRTRREAQREHTPGPIQDRDVQLSKALSYALRHGALKLGLPMGADGFVPLGALLQLPQFRSFSAEDVQRVVDTNEKQRFTLQPGDPSTGPLIRANQGHSLQVPALELIPLETPQALPLMLVHGTFWRHWPSILLKGLFRQGRTHIHLAPGLPGDPGVISGMRPNCEVAVFINGPQALADGIPFFRSANGVILTPGNADGVLLPKYFKEALQLRPTRKPLSLAGNEETECQRGPKHSSRGRRTTPQ